MTTEVTREGILANLRAGRDEIATIVDDGSYVLMTKAYPLFFRADAQMATGLSHATRYTRRQATVTGCPNVTNGKGDQFKPTPIATAKAFALADLEKTIHAFENA